MPNENIELLFLITTLCPFFRWSFFLFWKLTMTRSSLMSKSLRRSRAVSEKRLPARNMRHNPKASSQFSSVPRLIVGDEDEAVLGVQGEPQEDAFRGRLNSLLEALNESGPA